MRFDTPRAQVVAALQKVYNFARPPSIVDAIGFVSASEFAKAHVVAAMYRNRVVWVILGDRRSSKHARHSSSIRICSCYFDFGDVLIAVASHVSCARYWLTPHSLFPVALLFQVDCCIRWSACSMATSKGTIGLLDCISTSWVIVFGVPKTLTLDVGRGMRGKPVDDWALYDQVIDIQGATPDGTACREAQRGD